MAVEEEFYDPVDFETSVDALGHDHEHVAEYRALAADLREGIRVSTNDQNEDHQTRTIREKYDE